ncbi:MAG: P63C domain-containing protein [Cyanobacteria bacterium J06638_20]
MRLSKKDDKENNLPRVTHGAPDNPLVIGDIEIPCYVLNTRQRVFTRKGMIESLDMKRGGHVQKGSDRLARFVDGNRLKPFISKELRGAISDPILFQLSPSGQINYGYEATLLIEICKAVLQARAANVLQKQQLHVAQRCEQLIMGVASVGIIALVDEVTGYQQDRDAYALRRILDHYITPELRPWAKTFEDEYYEHIFRLKGWIYTPGSTNRPQIVGKLTNNIVYKRLPSGVLEELQRLNPINANGRRDNKHHQYLETFGKTHLRSHLNAVTALMRISPTWDKFEFLLDQALPKSDATPNIPGLEIDF